MKQSRTRERIPVTIEYFKRFYDWIVDSTEIAEGGATTRSFCCIIEVFYRLVELVISNWELLYGSYKHKLLSRLLQGRVYFRSVSSSNQQLFQLLLGSRFINACVAGTPYSINSYRNMAISCRPMLKLVQSMQSV